MGECSQRDVWSLNGDHESPGVDWRAHAPEYALFWCFLSGRIVNHEHGQLVTEVHCHEWALGSVPRLTGSVLACVHSFVSDTSASSFRAPDRLRGQTLFMEVWDLWPTSSDASSFAARWRACGQSRKREANPEFQGRGSVASDVADDQLGRQSEARTTGATKHCCQTYCAVFCGGPGSGTFDEAKGHGFSFPYTLSFHSLYLRSSSSRVRKTTVFRIALGPDLHLRSFTSLA